MFKRLLITAAAVFAILIAPPAFAAERYGTLKKIEDSGRIVMGYRASSPPFSRPARLPPEGLNKGDYSSG